MKNKHILKWVGMCMVLLLIMQTAVQAGYYLPESSTWQGGRNYETDDVKAYVEYAVYNAAKGLPTGITNPGTGRYVYAYQIFNYGADFDPIKTFKLIGGNPIEATGIGYQNDGKSGLIPDNDDDAFVWRFTNGTFIADQHSAFLVFSSESGPVAGNFSILTTLDNYGDELPTNLSEGVDGPGPGATAEYSSAPEPTTITLLSMGVLGLLKRRKNS